MSAVTRVPETASMPAHELPPTNAGEMLRRYGRWTLAREAFRRFRFGDGFTSSRALGLQLALALVPFLIFLVAVGGTGDDCRSLPGPLNFRLAARNARSVVAIASRSQLG